MRTLEELRRRVRALRARHARRSRDQDLDEEIRTHIEMASEEYVARGMSPEAAGRAARRDFGGVDQVKERHREARGIQWTEELLREGRLTVRRLRRRPGFTLVAVSTLALAIGANSSVFSVVDAVLLEPLPFPEPHRLVALWEVSPEGNARNVVSRGNYMDWRDGAESFQAVGAYQQGTGRILRVGDDTPERITGSAVTPGLFDALQVPAALGRTFVSGEGSPGGEPVAVLSHDLWQARFAGVPSVIGTRIQLDGAARTVVGVMPESFDFPAPDVDVWIPWTLSEEDRQNRRSHSLLVIGRLDESATTERAQEELDALAARFSELYPEDMAGWGVNVQALGADLVASSRPTLVALVGVTALVLLLACVNLANLLVAEGLSRHRERSLMQALGSGRGRIVRQGLIEAAALASMGGLAGLLLAKLSVDAFVSLGIADLPNLESVGIDVRVLGFTAGLTVLSTLIFGAGPALGLTRGGANSALTSTGARTTEGRGLGLRRGLLLGEVAISVMLLAGAGLMVRSFVELQTQEYGFEPEGILAVMIDLPEARYPNGTADHAPFFAELLERVAGLPGVESAAGSSDLPAGFGSMTFSFAIEGRPRPGPRPREEPQPLRIVTPGYFQTLGIPVLDGRAIDETDDGGSRPVIVINDALRRLHWPTESPVGRRISFEGPEGPWLEVVGVVGDTRHYSMDAPLGPAMYLPHAQKPWDWASWLNLVVRAAGDPSQTSSGVRAVLAELDDQIIPSRVAELTDLYSETNARRRLVTVLISVFAGFGLLIGSIGVHGLIAASVARRTREIGVRMAIGAEQRRVVFGIVREGMTLAAVGTALGIVGAFGLTRFLESLVYGVGTRDPVTFLTVSLVMLMVAATAAFLPAYRASRIDPMQALRSE